MPHLVQMDKRHGSKGLQVIGVHRQNVDADTVRKKVKDLKIKFPVVDNGSQPVPTNGIPHMFVFDLAGKLVFSGHPMDKEAEKAVKGALAKVTTTQGSSLKPAVKPALIPSRKWTNDGGKEITAEVMAIEDDSVEFRMPDGKLVKYPIAKLSEEDQKFLKKGKDSPEEDR